MSAKNNKTRKKENVVRDKYVKEDEKEGETQGSNEEKVKIEKEPSLDSTHVSTNFTIHNMDFMSPTFPIVSIMKDTSPMTNVSLEGVIKKGK